MATTAEFEPGVGKKEAYRRKRSDIVQAVSEIEDKVRKSSIPSYARPLIRVEGLVSVEMVTGLDLEDFAESESRLQVASYHSVVQLRDHGMDIREVIDEKTEKSRYFYELQNGSGQEVELFIEKDGDYEAKGLYSNEELLPESLIVHGRGAVGRYFRYRLLIERECTQKDIQLAELLEKNLYESHIDQSNDRYLFGSSSFLLGDRTPERLHQALLEINKEYRERQPGTRLAIHPILRFSVDQPSGSGFYFELGFQYADDILRTLTGPEITSNMYDNLRSHEVFSLIQFIAGVGNLDTLMLVAMQRGGLQRVIDREGTLPLPMIIVQKNKWQPFRDTWANALGIHGDQYGEPLRIDGFMRSPSDRVDQETETMYEITRDAVITLAKVVRSLACGSHLHAGLIINRNLYFMRDSWIEQSSTSISLLYIYEITGTILESLPDNNPNRAALHFMRESIIEQVRSDSYLKNQFGHGGPYLFVSEISRDRETIFDTEKEKLIRALKLCEWCSNQIKEQEAQLRRVERTEAKYRNRLLLAKRNRILAGTNRDAGRVLMTETHHHSDLRNPIIEKMKKVVGAVVSLSEMFSIYGGQNSETDFQKEYIQHLDDLERFLKSVFSDVIDSFGYSMRRQTITEIRALIRDAGNGKISAAQEFLSEVLDNCRNRNRTIRQSRHLDYLTRSRQAARQYSQTLFPRMDALRPFFDQRVFSFNDNIFLHRILVIQLGTIFDAAFSDTEITITRALLRLLDYQEQVGVFSHFQQYLTGTDDNEAIAIIHPFLRMPRRCVINNSQLRNIRSKYTHLSSRKIQMLGNFMRSKYGRINQLQISSSLDERITQRDAEEIFTPGLSRLGYVEPFVEGFNITVGMIPFPGPERPPLHQINSERDIGVIEPTIERLDLTVQESPKRRIPRIFMREAQKIVLIPLYIEESGGLFYVPYGFEVIRVEGEEVKVYGQSLGRSQVYRISGKGIQIVLREVPEVIYPDQVYSLTKEVLSPRTNQGLAKLLLLLEKTKGQLPIARDISSALEVYLSEMHRTLIVSNEEERRSKQSQIMEAFFDRITIAKNKYLQYDLVDIAPNVFPVLTAVLTGKVSAGHCFPLTHFYAEIAQAVGARGYSLSLILPFRAGLDRRRGIAPYISDIPHAEAIIIFPNGKSKKPGSSPTHTTRRIEEIIDKTTRKASLGLKGADSSIVPESVVLLAPREELDEVISEGRVPQHNSQPIARLEASIEDSIKRTKAEEYRDKIARSVIKNLDMRRLIYNTDYLLDYILNPEFSEQEVQAMLAENEESPIGIQANFITLYRALLGRTISYRISADRVIPRFKTEQESILFNMLKAIVDPDGTFVSIYQQT